MNVAIIPARGGSKGIPGKNLTNINGLPLIAWTINQAATSECIDLVFVTTDSAEISHAARANGAKVIARPDNLATDSASSEACLEHAINYIESEYAAISTVIFLQCTSPIRKKDDIDNAYRLYHGTHADSLLSVVPSHTFFWQQDSEGFATPINYDYQRRPRRQDIDNAYQENGSIYIFSPELFRLNYNRLGGKIVLYEMLEASAYEIDTETDLRIVEMLLKSETRNAY